MRIAHISDLHVLALEGVPWTRLLTNKRLTGYANVLLRRGRRHRVDVVRALARDLASMNVDHVAVTGDLTNLALETEFGAVRDVIEQDLRLPPSAVTIVPGNHDRYTKGSYITKRFEQYFKQYLKSDLAVPSAFGIDDYPVVKLRGPVALVGLCTAMPRLPFVASGQVGRAQLAAFGWILQRREVTDRLLVLLAHHPVFDSRGRIHELLEGLRDAPALREELQGCSQGLVLHGHLHRREQRVLRTRAGELRLVTTASASLIDKHGGRMAGYNLYEIDGSGQVQGIWARVFDLQTWSFKPGSVPLVGDGRPAG